MAAVTIAEIDLCIQGVRYIAIYAFAAYLFNPATYGDFDLVRTRFFSYGPPGGQDRGNHQEFRIYPRYHEMAAVEDLQTGICANWS